MNYALRAKEWITDHDIRQKTLAKEFGISESMLSHYLSGRNDISVDLLVKLARHFHVSMDYLVGLTDHPEPPIHLSDTERELVDRFRTLSKDQKELVVGNVRLMQEQNQR